MGAVVFVFAFVIVGVFVSAVVARVQFQRKLARSGIQDIDRFGGKTFEQYLEILFRRLGYRVERTRFVGDYGGDLVVRKDGVRTVVQAKRYSKSVGVRAVQEAVAAKGYYDCTEAMVVSNSQYTTQAEHLAKKNQVVLWDREMLVRQLTTAGAKQEVAAQMQTGTPATQAPSAALPTVETCARCSKVLAAGERQYCQRYAARFSGKMLCFRHQRVSRASGSMS